MYYDLVWVNVTCMDLDNVMKTSWPCFSIQCLPLRAVSVCTQHIHWSLLRGKIITNCGVFAIIYFQLHFFLFLKLFLQLCASLSMMWCFVLNLFSLFTFTGGFEVDLCLMVAAVTMLALLFETGILSLKSEGIWLVTYTSARQSWYDEHDGHADDFLFFIFFKHLTRQGVDWLTYEASLHEPVNSRHFYIQHGQTFALHMKDVLTQWSAGLEKKTSVLWWEKLCLVNKRRFIYTACLYVMFFALGSFHLPWCVMPMNHLSGTGTKNVT